MLSLNGLRHKTNNKTFTIFSLSEGDGADMRANSQIAAWINKSQRAIDKMTVAQVAKNIIEEFPKVVRVQVLDSMERLYSIERQ